MLLLNNASLIAGMACGTMVGYTLSSTGNLFNNALIATSCGVSRAVGRIVFYDSTTNEIICQKNEGERDALLKKRVIFHELYQANLGFGFGITLGSTVSAESLSTAVLNGLFIHAFSFFSETIPALAIRKPLVLKFADGDGYRLI